MIPGFGRPVAEVDWPMTIHDADGSLGSVYPRITPRRNTSASGLLLGRSPRTSRNPAICEWPPETTTRGGGGGPHLSHLARNGSHPGSTGSDSTVDRTVPSDGGPPFQPTSALGSVRRRPLQWMAIPHGRAALTRGGFSARTGQQILRELPQWCMIALAIR